MKKLIFFLTLLSFACIACNDDPELIPPINPENGNFFCNNNLEEQVFEFQYYDLIDTALNLDWLIAFPDCFSHIEKQGIDSRVGDFESDIDSAIISYDIGYLAGVYVRDSTLRGQSVDFEFWYEERDAHFYFSFPELSANFFTENKNLAEWIKIMETVSKE